MPANVFELYELTRCKKRCVSLLEAFKIIPNERVCDSGHDFIDPITGAHTNTVERMLGVAKASFRKWFGKLGNHSELLDRYLCEFLWEQRLPDGAL